MPNYFKLFSSSRSLLRTDFYGLLFGAALLDSTDPFNTLLQITRDGKLGTLKVDSETVDLKETISDWLNFFFLFLFLLLSFFSVVFLHWTMKLLQWLFAEVSRGSPEAVKMAFMWHLISCKRSKLSNAVVEFQLFLYMLRCRRLKFLQRLTLERW